MTEHISRMQIIWLFVCLTLLQVRAVVACGSFVDPKGRSPVDFAPLPGFVDNCWPMQICEMFLPIKDSPYYPVGLFYDPDEFATYGSENFRKGSMKQLTANLLGQGKSDSLDSIKDELRKLPTQPVQDETQGRMIRQRKYTGITDESSELVSFGATERESISEENKLYELRTTIGTFLKIKGEMVQLFVTESWKPPFEGGKDPDGDSTKALSRRWIACIKDKNK